jgi:hypothetical protein
LSSAALAQSIASFSIENVTETSADVSTNAHNSAAEANLDLTSDVLDKMSFEALGITTTQSSSHDMDAQVRLIKGYH